MVQNVLYRAVVWILENAGSEWLVQSLTFSIRFTERDAGVSDHGKRDGMTARGIVKFWNGEDGYGFVTPIEGDKIFCHANSILDGNVLHPGTWVEFTYRYDRYKNQYSADNLTGGKDTPRPGWAIVSHC